MGASSSSPDRLGVATGIFGEGTVTVAAPLCWSHSTALGAVAASADAPGAKDAETAVSLLRVDVATGTSVVRCVPKTGRSHQIRIHLSHLGHPIANDEAYGGHLSLIHI